jgi:hypothetical protein
MVQVMKQARHSDIRITMRYFKAELRLAKLIAAWPMLPKAIKAAILALVNA